MIVAKQKLTKKKIITYVAVIGLLVVANAAIYLFNSRTTMVDDGYLEDLNNISTEAQNTQPATVASHGNQSVLDNKIFNTLKKIGNWPVIPQNVGKSDPFAPFFSSQ
ncbi:MAG TPA: hypothetical protein PLR18_02660 [bacterium]|nr:hypothetical protein [bacterium]